MGTRHLIWYVLLTNLNSKRLLALKILPRPISQFDGYPEGQGIKILRFLSVARNIEHLKRGLEHHVYEPTPEELDAIWDECEAWDRAREAQRLPYERDMFGVNHLYPSLARETSAKLLGIVARAGAGKEVERGKGKKQKKIPVSLALEFANDGLFCEWTYVADLDKEESEVYGGPEKKR
ncbi:hypothetical protein N0V88_004430 [Collariella sp. IMI 366227]|nr:hypothetical protein N0V88_004430 [Collariella sp. IMI 366227]